MEKKGLDTYIAILIIVISIIILLSIRTPGEKEDTNETRILNMHTIAKDLGGGRTAYTITSSSNPIAYPTENGYRHINTTIKEQEKRIENETYGYSTSEGLYKAYYKTMIEPEDTFHASLEKDNITIKYLFAHTLYIEKNNSMTRKPIIQMKKTTGETHNNTMTYNGCYHTDKGEPTGSLKLSAYNTHINKEIILENKSYIIQKYRENYGTSKQNNIYLSTDIRIEITQDQIPLGIKTRENIIQPYGEKKETTTTTKEEIYIINKEGETEFTIPILYAYDNKGNSIRLEKKITTKNGETTLTIRTPYSWLIDKKTTYPVRIDPTYTVYSTAWDGWVFASHSDWSTLRTSVSTGVASYDTGQNVGAITAMYDEKGEQYTIYRSFLQLDTSGITDTDTITSAYLNVTGYTNADSNVMIQQGTQGTSLDNGDFKAYTGTGLVDIAANWITGENSFILNATGKSIISKTGYTYICLREGTHDYGGTDPEDLTYRNGMRFSESSNDPYLYIVTTEGTPNNEPVLSNENPSNSSWQITLQPSCEITANDQDGNNMDITFASNSSGSWVNYQTNTSVGNGTYRWDFTQANTGGTRYWWKVYADDGTANISETYMFVTDTNVTYLKEYFWKFNETITKDVGRLEPSLPSTPNFVRCGAGISLFYNDSSYSWDGGFIVENIYTHAWLGNCTPVGEKITTFGYNRTWNYKPNGPSDVGPDTTSFDYNDTICTVNMATGDQPRYSLAVFTMTIGDLSNLSYFDGGDKRPIGNLSWCQYEGEGGNPEFSGPNVTCHPELQSFIIFNVPDNNTLNISYSDTDSDSLSDWTELYVTHTNPFETDTDNDGYSDYVEYNGGTDPNNYTDYEEEENPGPNITYVDDLETIELGTNVTLGTGVNDSDGIGEVWINITKPDDTPGGNHSTYRAFWYDNLEFYYMNTPYETDQLGEYTFFVWANDTLGNSNMSTGHTFTVSDTTEPSITIKYAGNTSDWGGPYYTGPGESVTLAAHGYYTNDSLQHENDIYINCTITDTHGVHTAKLHLYDTNTSTWYNASSMSNPGGNYWEITKESLVANHKYTFDIWANDTTNNQNTTNWNKTGLGETNGEGATRRYWRAGGTPVSLDYTILYFQNITYVQADANRKDRLHHDQAADGTPTDTGYINSALPGETLESLWCTRYWAAWIDKTICLEDDWTLDNYHYHLWTSIQDGENDKTLAWKKTRDAPTPTDYLDQKILTNQSSITNMTISDDPPPDGWNNLYRLNDGGVTVETTNNFTDNSIYELVFMLDTLYATSKPALVFNRSMLSYVILNVPDNDTLNNTGNGDTDDDGLQDWDELYRTYTNPFISDTDNDGYTDYLEDTAGTDPNNYTDMQEYVVECSQYIYGYDGETSPNNWCNFTVIPGGNNVPGEEDIEDLTFIKAEELGGTSDGYATVSWNDENFSYSGNYLAIKDNMNYSYGIGDDPSQVESWSYTGAVMGTSYEFTVPAGETLWIWYRIVAVTSPLPDGEYTQAFTWSQS